MSELLPIAYLNGRYLPLQQAKISPLDRGFLFGEGIYEVIPVYAGRTMKLEAHMQRLTNSCRKVNLPNPLAGDAGPALVCRLIKENGSGDMSVYLQITRGAVDGPRNHVYSGAGTATVFAMCQSNDPRDRRIASEGITAITRPDTRWQYCDIKSTSLIANTILRQEAADAGADESILIRNGLITEGAASTVLIVRDGVVYTPRRSEQILPGTTLGLIVKLLASVAVEVREADLDETALHSAEELWLASSVREALPVCRLDGESIGDGRPGPLWRTLDRLYQEHKQRLGEST